ncbi:MAG: DUF4249 domain-containing protein [Bacteroidales bacterium]|nr:DUF4249 domain-containing protein [Bacteroidales bacterium]MBN2632807.1 DUF4249 domain-containing protein [Bacteroidales bacterium]
MRYRSFIYFVMPVFMLAGSGCEKYINYVNSPVYEQKLVITSFISPSDTVSQILVSSNQPLYTFSEKPEERGDITGTISDGTNEVQLDTMSTGLFFSRDKMPVSPGKTYTLKISSSKGLYAEASATVPRQREMLIKVDTVTSARDIYNYMPYNELMITIEFTDHPGEKNFYTVIGKFSGYKSDPENNYSSPRYWLEYMNDLKANPDNRIRMDSWITPVESNYDSAFLRVYILNTEESFYLYHTSLNEYEQSDNPFSEAKPVFSNIHGGLGIFASYVVDSLVLRVK